MAYKNGQTIRLKTKWNGIDMVGKICRITKEDGVQELWITMPSGLYFHAPTDQWQLVTSKDKIKETTEE